MSSQVGSATPQRATSSHARRQHSEQSNQDSSDGNGYSSQRRKSTNKQKKKVAVSGEYVQPYAVDHAGLLSPPRPSNTTPSKQAYAGPTFHASPAASTLPMPKFLSRSMPAQEPSPIADAQKLEHVVPPNQRQGSPLDLLFNAQRAEKARHGSGSPLARAPDANVKIQQQTPHRDARFFRPSTARQSSNKELFLMEMDGASEASEAEGESSGSVRFQDRLRASLTESPSPREMSEEQQRAAKSRALKSLLFSQTSQTVATDRGQNARRSMPPASTSDEHGSVGLSTPQQQQQHHQQHHTMLNEQKQSEHKSMEDDLKRILKLNVP